ncbi:energy transducer TonB [Hymenobacter sp. DH14]|uniref:Energy transducer TonB n=1 Tax=Hymenobacter cyanobacteriorum TaxID=2926463 RepID=A0A9X2AH10_9BACT|nr:energy transducer TonB [Hymenobacter cyanobacteriorum]MCI1188258.1 energy transducer TonB [Hymenobacter cyanobacteriorum]
MLRGATIGCGLLLLAGAAAAQTASVAPIAQTDGGHAPAAALAAAPIAPTIYFAAEEMPAFPGGPAAMLTFLSRKTNYPADALDHQVSGKVHVAFVVDANGHLRDPHVVRGLGHGLDEEALRLVRIMPWWTPGRINGQPVWVSVTLPIGFRAL